MSLQQDFHRHHERYNNGINDLFQAIDLSLQNKEGLNPIETMKEIISVDTDIKKTAIKIIEHQEIQKQNQSLEMQVEIIKKSIIISVLSLDKLSTEMAQILKQARKCVNTYQGF